MDLFDLLLTRRSIRQYTGQPVSQEDLRAVLAAGLLSPSSRSRRRTNWAAYRRTAWRMILSNGRVWSTRSLLGLSRRR